MSIDALYHRNWWPVQAVKIAPRDLPSCVVVERPGRHATCLRCLGVGYDRLLFCPVCNGAGCFWIPPAVIGISRPRSPLRIWVRWTDPTTHITHARTLPKSKSKGSRPGSSKRGTRSTGYRPSCGANGMPASLPASAFRDYTTPITCGDCLAIVERSTLADAGDVPLVARPVCDDPIPVGRAALDSDWRP